MGRNFRLFCTIDGGIGVAFALGLLALPNPLMQVFGMPLDASGVLFAHATGAALLACSLILVVMRDARPSSELVAFLRCLGLGDMLLGSVFLSAAAYGLMNALGYGLGALCVGAGVVFFFYSRLAGAQART